MAAAASEIARAALARIHQHRAEQAPQVQAKPASGVEPSRPDDPLGDLRELLSLLFALGGGFAAQALATGVVPRGTRPAAPPPTGEDATAEPLDWNRGLDDLLRRSGIPPPPARPVEEAPAPATGGRNGSEAGQQPTTSGSQQAPSATPEMDGSRDGGSKPDRNTKTQDNSAHTGSTATRTGLLVVHGGATILPDGSLWKEYFYKPVTMATVANVIAPDRWRFADEQGGWTEMGVPNHFSRPVVQDVPDSDAAPSRLRRLVAGARERFTRSDRPDHQTSARPSDQRDPSAAPRTPEPARTERRDVGDRPDSIPSTTGTTADETFRFELTDRGWQPVGADQSRDARPASSGEGGNDERIDGAEVGAAEGADLIEWTRGLLRRGYQAGAETGDGRELLLTVRVARAPFGEPATTRKSVFSRLLGEWTGVTKVLVVELWVRDGDWVRVGHRDYRIAEFPEGAVANGNKSAHLMLPTRGRCRWPRTPRARSPWSTATRSSRGSSCSATGAAWATASSWRRSRCSRWARKTSWRSTTTGTTPASGTCSSGWAGDRSRRRGRRHVPPAVGRVRLGRGRRGRRALPSGSEREPRTGRPQPRRRPDFERRGPASRPGDGPARVRLGDRPDARPCRRWRRDGAVGHGGRQRQCLGGVRAGARPRTRSGFASQPRDSRTAFRRSSSASSATWGSWRT